ncbi:hypothetical protein [Ferrimonas lipolytica]|uniref:Lipoprotein n=1 Tax=Ferrimonas lipolytica TaxID=2724191 RepID=A0A6H1UJ04_9GAMM|nr:hypothetical protein [Ferrimonas lipolytica]QIZ78609.1 hypothetical protein HER31_17885 [Ferrimonas lipolytica]
MAITTGKVVTTLACTIGLSGCIGAVMPEPTLTTQQFELPNVYRADLYQNVRLELVPMPRPSSNSDDQAEALFAQQIEQMLAQQLLLNPYGRYELRAQFQQPHSTVWGNVAIAKVHYTLTDSHTSTTFIDQAITGVGTNIHPFMTSQISASTSRAVEDNIARVAVAFAGSY